jgi:hypothetical protein
LIELAAPQRKLPPLPLAVVALKVGPPLATEQFDNRIDGAIPLLKELFFLPVDAPCPFAPVIHSDMLVTGAANLQGRLHDIHDSRPEASRMANDRMPLPEFGVKMNALTSAMPRRLLPMLATSSAPFDDPACLFEVKWDGVRAMSAITTDSLRLWVARAPITLTAIPSLPFFENCRPARCSTASWLSSATAARISMRSWRGTRAALAGAPTCPSLSSLASA